MAKNTNNCAVLRVSEKTREKLIKFYEDKKRDKVIPYVVFQAQDGDTVVTLLALSIPNIAVFWFLVKSKKQKPPFAAISLNILMHIGWGSVLSKSLKIGVQFNYVAGILIIVIILISTIILLICSCLKDKHYSIFTKIYIQK